MSFVRRLVCTAVLMTLFAASGCTDDGETAPARSATASTSERPLPPPVEVRSEPEGITLADSAFEPLPGARAEFGRLGGAVYQIEIPDEWNRGLVMWMHGFGEFAPEANVAPPDFRRYLIANGYAWAASSYSSTSLIPHRGADETAALWDYFVREHGRPDRTYVSGLSMGGWSSHIAAERYGDRYDGALALCGAAGTVPGLRISANYFVAGAYVAGVRQAEYDASQDIGQLINERIRPALDDPDKRALFDRIMVDLTGGPRAFAREGIHDEEDTNFERARLIVAARLTPPRETPYRLGPDNPVTSKEFNRDAIVIPTSDAYDEFSEGMEVTGNLAMPLITLHTTGDGQVPINQAQILRDRVEAAGQSDRLVQPVIEDPGHCGFSTSEQEAAFRALVAWVEHGHKPEGTNLDTKDLTNLDQTFEDRARAGPHPIPNLRSPSAAERHSTASRSTRDGWAPSSDATGSLPPATSPFHRARTVGTRSACTPTRLPPAVAGADRTCCCGRTPTNRSSTPPRPCRGRMPIRRASMSSSRRPTRRAPRRRSPSSRVRSTTTTLAVGRQAAASRPTSPRRCAVSRRSAARSSTSSVSSDLMQSPDVPRAGESRSWSIAIQQPRPRSTRRNNPHTSTSPSQPHDGAKAFLGLPGRRRPGWPVSSSERYLARGQVGTADPRSTQRTERSTRSRPPEHTDRHIGGCPAQLEERSASRMYA
jgi:pimeloyl-ACP methyl ester carboxylesterase